MGLTTVVSVSVETGSDDAGFVFVLDSVDVVSEVVLEVEFSVLPLEGTVTSEKGKSVSGISGSR